jgi:hypothetical protein
MNALLLKSLRRFECLASDALRKCAAFLGLVLCVTATTSDAATAIVMRITFNDGAAPSCSASSIAGFMFNNTLSVNQFYLEASYGSLGWSGVVRDVSINYGQTPCQRDTWADAADNAARQQGFEPLNYTVRVYILPSSVPNCGYGLAAGNRVWSFQCTDLNLFMHEVGHSLGMHHSSTDLDNNGVIDNEYGDASDTMGAGGYIHNAPHKVQMGWFGASTITANGTYTVSHAQGSTGTRAFRINPPSGAPYYFSYRQPAGFDSGNKAVWANGGIRGPLGSPYTDGVNVHRHSGSAQTLYITRLTDGSTYTIPGTSISIRQNSHGTTSASFTVSGMGATTTGAKFFADINYGGTATQPIPAGNYTLAQLQGYGFVNDWASSVQIPTGWTVTMYGNDNFGGTIWTLTANQPNFTQLTPNANDLVSSCRISSGGGFTGPGTYRLTPKVATGSALDVPNSSTTDGTQLQIWAWGGGSNQKFNIIDVGGGYYKLQLSYATTKVVDVNGSGSANGTKVQLWGDNGSAAQKWKIVDMGGGYYKLQPQCALSSCLDVNGGNPANGTKVQIWSDNSSDAQRWKLERQ